MRKGEFYDSITRWMTLFKFEFSTLLKAIRLMSRRFRGSSAGKHIIKHSITITIKFHFASTLVAFSSILSWLNVYGDLMKFLWLSYPQQWQSTCMSWNACWKSRKRFIYCHFEYLMCFCYQFMSFTKPSWQWSAWFSHYSAVIDFCHKSTSQTSNKFYIKEKSSNSRLTWLEDENDAKRIKKHVCLPGGSISVRDKLSGSSLMAV
jgi:hypothetical protein